MKKFMSRKMLMVLGAGAVAALSSAGMPEEAAQETVKWLLGLVAVYVAGQSAVDASGKGRGESNAAD
jgi:cytochrome c oxidase assembly factor CtaG